MSITVTFACNGCFKVAEETPRLARHFDSFNGKGHGFGHYRYDTAEDVTPEGWVAYDIIGCCYCPDCVAELERPEEELA